ncbi:MAG: response regulator, partial [Candidatus Competibacteraceae bacterium]|nr:response regulator [Candidatus Competibacteraceae bacterium]
GRVVMANQEASRLLGATPLPNRSFRRLLAGRPAGTLRRMRRRLLAGDGQVTGRLTLRRNAGPPLTLEVTVNRVTRQGEELYVCLLGEALQQATADLAESEGQKAAILEAAVDAIVILDRQGLITGFNPAAERIFGHKRESIIGLSLVDQLIPARDRDRQRTNLTRLMECGCAKQLERPMEVTALRADGSEIPLEVAIAAIGPPPRPLWVAYCRDISERHQREEELRLTRDQAESASRAKSEFLATMSHEIRTPLNAILGTLTLLQDTPLNEEQRNFAETAQESGKALLTLINDILDFSKIEAGRLVLEETDFDLVSLVEGVAELLAPRAHGRHIELSTLIEPSVPTWLRMDAGRLRQVLLNLAGNAIKFTRKGGVALTVELAAARQEQVQLRFTVADTGIGIAQADQHKLFEKFTQIGPSHARRYGGTGLGLAICRSLVELLGGEIGFQSLVSQGSRFYFTVNARQASPEHRPSTQYLPRLLAGLRVLIVEDNSVSRRSHLRLLRGWGVEASAQPNGLAALEALEDARQAGEAFQTVLIDQWLADMSGEELGRTIQERETLSDTRLIMMAVMGTPSIHSRVRRLGFDAALVKPVRQNSLFRWLGMVNDLLPREPGDETLEEPPEAPIARRGRLLLAEDSHANQLVATAMLTKAGFQVDTASDGMEAVQAVRTLDYDLVLMDLWMPEMDGFEATAEIRQLPGERSRLPVVAMTANAMSGDRERCLNAGMNDYLTKPIDRRQLLLVLDKWLGHRYEIPPNRCKQPASPSSGTTVDGVLDPTILAQLRADTDGALLGRVVGIFVQEARQRLVQLTTALERGDWQRLQREAHTLKSGAGTFGALELQDHARRLDEACRKDDHKQALTLASTIGNTASRALAALEQQFVER